MEINNMSGGTVHPEIGNQQALLKRVFMFLEDGEWTTADEYCEKVLDMDPECAEAYLGKLMAELQVSKRENLKNYAESFENSKNYQKVIRFGSEELKAEVEDCIAYIHEKIYNRATHIISKPTTEGAYREAERLFRSIGAYKDAEALAVECSKHTEMMRKAKTARTNKCVKKIAVVAAMVCVVIVGCILVNTIIIPQSKYNKAVKLKEEKRYAAAMMAFLALGDYSDAREQAEMLWEKSGVRETLSAGGHHIVGLKSDGTVVAVGDYVFKEHIDVRGWHDIVAVSAGGYHTVGLKSDGTVMATGNNEYGQYYDVSEWTNIVAVSAGSYHTIGLKSDGTVVATGNNEYGQCDVSEWKGIVAIPTKGFNIIGLKSDGTIVTTNSWDNEKVSMWTDIVAVSTTLLDIVGLKSDGTVVTTSSYYSDELANWTDIKVLH